MLCSGLALYALLPACAGGPPASAGGSDEPLASVLLFPLNVVAALPTDVESGVGPVSEELAAELAARGYEVESVELRAARDAWLEGALALKAEVGPDKMSFDGAASMLARRLAAQRPFDVLILPWLVVGPASKGSGAWVRWDGIKRKIQLAEREGERVQMGRIGAYKEWLERVSGSLPAASVQVAAFSPTGAKLCQRAGGLDLLVDVAIESQGRTIYFDWAPKAAPLEDRRHLREGVLLALRSCPGSGLRARR